MPKVTPNNLTLNYDQQGSGEPLILITLSGALPGVVGGRPGAVI